MSRILWLTAFLLAATTGCGDSPVGPVQGSFTSNLTSVEPVDPSELGTCCPSPRACGPGTGAGTCDQPRCCPASHCDAEGRHK